MKQIKNNYKFSNEKNYNEKFLYELENKEEFGCIANVCAKNQGLCGANACALRVIPIPCLLKVGPF